MLCTASIVLFANEASAQCTARDVVRNHLTLRKTSPADMPPIPVRSAVAVPVWKRITVGTFANWFALRNALDAAGCGIGGQAEEILARPTFTLGAAKTDVELVAVSAAELGFQTETASLADIYARAQQPGFAPAASFGHAGAYNPRRTRLAAPASFSKVSPCRTAIRTDFFDVF
jgi:hypothetical protein